MSVVTTSTSKGEKSKKFQSLDINNIYQGSATKPQQKTLPQKHGLQSLGKVPTARRAPANLPSLKAENSGNDPTISIVPTGSSGWGKDEPNSNSSTKPGNGVTSGGSTVSSTSNGPSTKASTHDHVPQQQQQRPPPGQPDVTSSQPPSSSGPPSWKNVATTQQPSFLGQRSNPLFGQEFPSLTSNSDDFSTPPPLSGSASTGSIAQKLRGETNDLKYGPGPNLRPQSYGNWALGGGSKPQNEHDPSTPSHQQQQQQQPSHLISEPRSHPIVQQPPPPSHVPAQVSSTFKFDVTTKPGQGNISALRKSASTSNADLDRNTKRPYSTEQQQRGRQRNFPGSGPFQQQIIDAEKLKRLDELDNAESDWTKSDDTFDYNKKIASDDEDDYKSNWADQVKPKVTDYANDSLNPQPQRRLVAPSSDFLAEEEERRAKNEEVLKTIERAKRRREEEEQKHKTNCSSSPYSAQPPSYNRNDYDSYHANAAGGGGRFDHRRQHSGGDNRGNRRSPAGFRQRENDPYRSGPQQQQPFGKFDVGAPGGVKEDDLSNSYNDRRGNKPSVPPRFKRNSLESHPIKRGSPPKEASPDLSGNNDSSSDTYSSVRGGGGSSTRKSPGWDRQSSSGGSEMANRDRHASAEKSAELSLTESASSSLVDSVSAAHRQHYNSGGSNKDFFDDFNAAASPSSEDWKENDKSYRMLGGRGGGSRGRRFDQRPSSTTSGSSRPIGGPQRKIILPNKSGARGNNASNRFPSSNKPESDAKMTPEDDDAAASIKNKTEEAPPPPPPVDLMKNLALGASSTSTPPPTLDQLQPKDQPSDLKKDEPSHVDDAGENAISGWFAPRGQPSRRGRGGVTGGPSGRPLPPHQADAMHMMNATDKEASADWDAASDRSFEDKKHHDFAAADSYFAGNRNSAAAARGGGRYDYRGGRGGGGHTKDNKRVGGNADRGGGGRDKLGGGYDNRRQSKLPPRLAKQKEQSRLANVSGGWEAPPDVPNAFSTWDQSQAILQQQRQHMMADFGSFREGEGVMGGGAAGDGGMSVNAAAGVAPPSAESQNTPVQTIIFENTNYKGRQGPVPPPQAQAPPPSMASLPNDKLGFKDMKPDGLQIGGFVDKEDSGLRLDFASFDASESAMHNGSQKPGLAARTHASTAANHHVNNHPTEDLNMKIASVKKVWEMSPVPDSFNSGFQNAAAAATNAAADSKAFVSSGSSNQASSSVQATSSSDMEPATTATSTSASNEKSESGGGGGAASNVAKVRPQQQQQQLNSAAQPASMPPHAGQHAGFPHLQDDRLSRAAAAMMSQGAAGGGASTGSYNHRGLPGLGSGVHLQQSPPSLLNQPPNLYQAFQLDHGRSVATNQLYSAYAGLGAQSVLLPSSGLSGNAAGTDMFGTANQNQFRLQGSGAAQFAAAGPGQQQSTGNTVLLPQSGLMSSTMKQSNQIGPIGTKGGNAPFQQSGLGTLPVSGTSPLHLIPYDGQAANINYAAMQRSAAAGQSGHTAFYHALAASQQQSAAATNRQQSTFPAAQGFAAAAAAQSLSQAAHHQMTAAQMRNAAVAAAAGPPPPQSVNYMKPEKGSRDGFGGLQHQFQGSNQPSKSYGGSSTAASGSSSNGPSQAASSSAAAAAVNSGRNYSPTPIRRPGHQGKAHGGDEDVEIADKKKSADEN